MSMNFIFISLFTFGLSVFFPPSGLQASLSLLSELLPDPEQAAEMPPPSPVALHPQWWNYFNVEGEELKRRIAIVNKNLQDLYVTLHYDDQVQAQPLINKIAVLLNALPQVK